MRWVQEVGGEGSIGIRRSKTLGRKQKKNCELLIYDLY